MMIHYGVYRLTLTGPPAALEEMGPVEVDVTGCDEDNLIFEASDQVARLAGYKDYDELPERFTPLAFSEPVVSANEFRNPDGSQQFFVGVYSVGQGYGGAEEGGWWFAVGDLVQQTAVASRWEAEMLRASLRNEFPDTGKRHSVLGGEDFDIYIGIKPHPSHFPETRPHYE